MEFLIYLNSPRGVSLKWDVEDALEDWLGETGEIVGAGAATDGSWANVTIDAFHCTREQVPEYLLGLQQLLRSLKCS